VGGSVILIRKMKDIHFAIVNGFYGVFLFVVSTLIYFICRFIIGSGVEYNFNTEQYIYMFFIGLIGATTNLCIIISIQLDKAARVWSIVFLLVLFGYIEDVLVFQY
jgi:hypothetical protein